MDDGAKGEAVFPRWRHICHVDVGVSSSVFFGPTHQSTDLLNAFALRLEPRHHDGYDNDDCGVSVAAQANSRMREKNPLINSSLSDSIMSRSIFFIPSRFIPSSCSLGINDRVDFKDGKQPWRQNQGTFLEVNRHFFYPGFISSWGCYIA